MNENDFYENLFKDIVSENDCIFLLENFDRLPKNEFSPIDKIFCKLKFFKDLKRDARYEIYNESKLVEFSSG